jgi:hypothetical protein
MPAYPLYMIRNNEAKVFQLYIPAHLGKTTKQLLDFFGILLNLTGLAGENTIGRKKKEAMERVEKRGTGMKLIKGNMNGEKCPAHPLEF